MFVFDWSNKRRVGGDEDSSLEQRRFFDGDGTQLAPIAMIVRRRSAGSVP
jgi:hypothetical protein